VRLLFVSGCKIFVLYAYFVIDTKQQHTKSLFIHIKTKKTKTKTKLYWNWPK